jgi:hypothetical protein
MKKNKITAISSLFYFSFTVLSMRRERTGWLRIEKRCGGWREKDGTKKCQDKSQRKEMTDKRAKKAEKA